MSIPLESPFCNFSSQREQIDYPCEFTGEVEVEEFYLLYCTDWS